MSQNAIHLPPFLLPSTQVQGGSKFSEKWLGIVRAKLQAFILQKKKKIMTICNIVFKPLYSSKRF